MTPKVPSTQLMRPRPWLFAIALTLPSLDGAISVQGNVSPSYPQGADPWTIGGYTTYGNSELFVWNTGKLRITDGSQVIQTGESLDFGFHGTSVGPYAGADASIEIDGAGSLLSNRGYLHIGHFGGKGAIRVSNGGKLQCLTDNNSGHVVIGAVTGGSGGSGSSGKITVTGAGSVFELISQELDVGDNHSDDSGRLEILAGASLQSDTAIEIHRRGSALVSGSGSTVQTGAVIRGDGTSQGSLVIADGGRVNGSVTNYGSVDVQASGGINGSTLAISNTGTMNIHVDRNHVVSLTGAVQNTGTLKFIAAPDAPSGTFTPILTTGIGGYQGVYLAEGGTWNASTREFTIPARELQTTPTVVSQPLGGRRFYWRRPRSSWWGRSWSSFAPPSSPKTTEEESEDPDPATEEDSLHVGFVSSAGTASFTATESTSMEPIQGELTLTCYDVTSELTPSDLVLSMKVGEEFDAVALSMWYSSDSGSNWSRIDSSSYGNGWMSTTPAAFGRFAVTTSEPLGNGKRAVVSVPVGGPPVVAFDTSVEKLYCVWSSDSPAGPWECIAQLAGDGTRKNMADPNGMQDRQFYVVCEN